MFFFADQLNVGCINCGLPTLGPALSVTFLPTLLSAGFVASVMSLTVVLAALMAAGMIACVTACISITSTIHCYISDCLKMLAYFSMSYFLHHVMFTSFSGDTTMGALT